VINDQDLTLLYLAHFRLSAHLSLPRGGAAPSARANSLRRVSAEALTDAAAARYQAVPFFPALFFRFFFDALLGPSNAGANLYFCTSKASKLSSSGR